MSDGRDTLLGILTIIIGTLIIAFPLFTRFTASALVGIGILFLGFWLLIISKDYWNYNKKVGIIYLTLSLIAIITGLILYENIPLFKSLTSILIYISGVLLLISGILALLGQNKMEKGAGILGVALGILYIISEYYTFNPYYLSLIIGIWLITLGMVQFFLSYEERSIFDWI